MNDAWIGIAGVVIGALLSSLTAAVSAVAGRRFANEDRRRAFRHETLLAIEQSLAVVATLRFQALASTIYPSADSEGTTSSAALSYEALQLHVIKMSHLAARIDDLELSTAIADLAETFTKASRPALTDDRSEGTWDGVLHAMIPVTHRVGQLLRGGL